MGDLKILFAALRKPQPSHIESVTEQNCLKSRYSCTTVLDLENLDFLHDYLRTADEITCCHYLLLYRLRELSPSLFNLNGLIYLYVHFAVDDYLCLVISYHLVRRRHEFTRKDTQI